MSNKFIKLDSNLETLYKSMIPNIIKLLGIDSRDYVDINKVSVSNYLAYIEMYFAYKHGLINYNTFLDAKKRAIKNSLTTVNGEPNQNIEDSVYDSLHVGYTIDVDLLPKDKGSSKSDCLRNDINKITVDTIHYNRCYLEYYLKIAQDRDYKDSSILGYIRTFLLKLYLNVLEAKSDELKLPLITVSYNLDDTNNEFTMLYAYMIVQFAIDVFSILNSNSDKIYLKDIKKDLEEVYTKHILIYSAIATKVENYNSLCGVNIEEFYNSCR